jgi:hypothetical protein
MGTFGLGLFVSKEFKGRFFNFPDMSHNAISMALVAELKSKPL